MKLKLTKKQEESKDFDFYSEEGVNESSDSDQIDAYEEAFMRGYLN